MRRLKEGQSQLLLLELDLLDQLVTNSKELRVRRAELESEVNRLRALPDPRAHDLVKEVRLEVIHNAERSDAACTYYDTDALGDLLAYVEHLRDEARSLMRHINDGTLTVTATSDSWEADHLLQLLGLVADED